jgi:DHA3 family macrolide efflux protein-like MFS transporter
LPGAGAEIILSSMSNPSSERPLAVGPAAGRLWNRNYFLIWQGNLVSAVGDVAYEIALGFWILAVTGSTALMGTLMAASVVPRVLLSPFAGVVVDRSDRKWMIVAMDAVRGVVVVLVGAAALAGLAKVWMVFAAGVIIGVGAAFFNPAVFSARPDIVPRERIVQANSFFSMIRAGSGILGNSLGGVLYALLGAPLMFLINGLSYLFSSGTELFITIPRIEHPRERTQFWSDMREGLSFVWRSRGLRFFLMAAGALNFFAWIGLVLLLPLFRQAAHLGAVRYGVLMAVFTTSSLAGMLAMAAAKVPAERRHGLFAVSTIAFVVPIVLVPVWLYFPLMLLLTAVSGFFNAIVNVLIQSVVQLAVPREMRGKVMGLLESLTQGLTPIAMALGGVLGQFLPLRVVMSVSFAMMGVVIIPQLFAPYMREFLSGQLAAEGAAASESAG